MIECILTYLSSNPHGSEDISVFSAETGQSSQWNWYFYSCRDYQLFRSVTILSLWKYFNALDQSEPGMLELDQSDPLLLIIQICHQDKLWSLWKYFNTINLLTNESTVKEELGQWEQRLLIIQICHLVGFDVKIIYFLSFVFFSKHINDKAQRRIVKDNIVNCNMLSFLT